MEREHLSHASTVLNEAFLYLIDKEEISLMNIACPSLNWKNIKIPEVFVDEQKFADKWKNGIIVFEKGSKEYSLFSEEGALQETKRIEKDQGVDCYHGLSTRSIKRSLVVCDDRYQILKIPIA